jgi:CxxC-x17-CxxC domain-containing protein
MSESYYKPRKMFDVICSRCNNKTQVPFEPKEGGPVYCRECLAVVRQERKQRES